MSRRKSISELTVQAKDTYDPRDYITVHLDYFNGMRAAIRHVHGGKCICIYCRHDRAASDQETFLCPYVLCETKVSAVGELCAEHSAVNR